MGFQYQVAFQRSQVVSQNKYQVVFHKRYQVVFQVQVGFQVPGGISKGTRWLHKRYQVVFQEVPVAFQKRSRWAFRFQVVFQEVQVASPVLPGDISRYRWPSSPLINFSARTLFRCRRQPPLAFYFITLKLISPRRKAGEATHGVLASNA